MEYTNGVKKRKVFKTPAKVKINEKKLPDDLVAAAKKHLESGSTSSTQSKSRSFADTYAATKSNEIEFKKEAHKEDIEFK
jgi:hypothetical protein